LKEKRLKGWQRTIKIKMRLRSSVASDGRGGDGALQEGGLVEEGDEDEGEDGRQLDEDVQRGA